MTESQKAGEYRTVQLGQGTIRYRDIGAGPTILFVHGVLVNGTLWRDVVPHLSGRFRCVVPDLPLGGHQIAMAAGTDLTPRVVAEIVAAFMVALDLRDVTLVGNDTGGAICQIVITAHPKRIARLVLTNCDAYEAFFPLLLRPIHVGFRFGGDRFASMLAWALKYRPAQRAFLKIVAKRRLDDATLDAYLSPFVRDTHVRRDATRFLASVSNRYTIEAAKRFPSFTRPVLIVWGEDDFVFSAKLARRLHDDFPDARLEFLADSRAFVPVDRPDALASHLAAFAAAP